LLLQKELVMDRELEQDRNSVSPDDMQPDKANEEAQKELDQIPPPGTDPLHEGP
jgi:hypothetical protein